MALHISMMNRPSPFMFGGHGAMPNLVSPCGSEMSMDGMNMFTTWMSMQPMPPGLFDRFEPMDDYYGDFDVEDEDDAPFPRAMRRRRNRWGWGRGWDLVWGQL